LLGVSSLDGWMDGWVDGWLLAWFAMADCFFCFSLLFLLFPPFWGATLGQLDKTQLGISSNNHNFCASA